MATISISQLDTATQAKVDDLYEVAVVDANSQTGYASRKLTAAQISTLIAQGIQFSGLSTEAKTIIAAINEAAQNGGTEVEANPAGEPTDKLETIGIDGTIYEVGASVPVSKTVTGNPIHIEDAADAPIVSGEVTFEPQQDLHGYNKPWAGGSGKNKLPMVIADIKSANTTGTWIGNAYTTNGVTFTIQTDSDGNVTGINVNGTATANARFYIWNGANIFNGYKMNTSAAGCSDATYFLSVGLNHSPWTENRCYDDDITVDLANNEGVDIFIFVVANIVVSNKIFYPMIRLATETDPAFEPYSNECPIEGYTDCEVDVTGKNLYHGTREGRTNNGVTYTVDNSTITASGTASATSYAFANGEWTQSNAILLPAGTYTISANQTAASAIAVGKVASAGGLESYIVPYSSDASVSFTVESDTYICVLLRINNGATVNHTFNFQLEVGGSTATAYEPYQSTPYTIDLDGTRYGGKVYPVTGKMSVGMGHIASYAGETIGEPWLSDRDEYVAGTTPSIGAEVVYTLASPTIVQLTPEQIRTLEGTNNISTNMTGMSLEYITQDYQPLVELIERSAGHHYSTQERVVGTWFDKPLYEKVFSVTLPTFICNQWTVIDSAELSNVSEMPECLALKDTSTQSELPSTFAVIGALNNNNKLQVMNLRNADYGSNIPARVIVRYTKTTD